MTTRSSVLRKASARIEALETRTLFAGEIDHSFGLDGRLPVTTPAGSVYSPNIVAKAVAVQPDGKIVVAGKAPGSAGTAMVVRYLPDGTLDPAFGNGGYATVKNVHANRIDNIAVLGGGKILVAGQTYFRLTTAGKLDTTYGGGDGVAPSLIAGDRRARQPDVIAVDGSVVEVSSGIVAKNQGFENHVFKFKADGSPDKTFGSGGTVNLGAYAADFVGGVATDANGRIYVSYLHDDAVHVLRLTAAGKIDAGFGKNGVATGRTDANFINGAIAVLSDGRVLATYYAPTGTPFATGLDVFDAKGAYKGSGLPTLPGSGAGRDIVIKSVRQAKDGSVYLGGDLYFSGIGGGFFDFDVTFAVVTHLKSDLSLDTGFSADRDGIGGFNVTNFTTGYVGGAFDSGGRPIILGADETGGGYVARLTAPGTPNRVTFSQSGNKLSVTGSADADTIGLRRFGKDYTYDGPADYGVFFDDTMNARSPDALFYRNADAKPLTTIDLGGGDDYLDAGSWSLPTTVNAGAGDDDIVLGSDSDGTTKAGMVVNGDDGNDAIMTGNGNDTLHGGRGNDDIAGIAGDDRIFGDDGNDHLTSGPGADSLYGGNGDDALDVLSASHALADGGPGIDTATYDANDVYTFVSIEKKIAV